MSASRIVLVNGDVVLPDRVQRASAVVLDGDRIAGVEARADVDPAGAIHVDCTDAYVVPGFVDVHVHGVAGTDTLDEGDAVARIARALPQYGVTAFCPTTVACPPAALRQFLQQVAAVRVARPPGAARVLGAHLESNFIALEYNGAQPAACLRLPPANDRDNPAVQPGSYTGQDLLDTILAARPDVAIVTLAPELPGGLALVRTLVDAGIRVSIGHSGADFDTAIAAFDAGVQHATHLFNRMPPLHHRSPGLVGAILARDDVAAELICDGHHVHPAMSRVAIAAKGTAKIIAITDGTAGSGLPVGARARLGGRSINVRADAAFLDDGTLAGSTLTMNGAFRHLVTALDRTPVEAALVCATTPARELGLTGFGVVAEEAVADLVVLDRSFRVLRTFIGGVQAYPAS